MNKDIAFKRLFTMGQYQNVTFEESMKDIPEEIFNNKEVMQNLKLLLIVDAELNYRKYLQMYQKLGAMNLETAMEMLEGTKVEIIEEIKNSLEKE